MVQLLPNVSSPILFLWGKEGRKKEKKKKKEKRKKKKETVKKKL